MEKNIENQKKNRKIDGEGAELYMGREGGMFPGTSETRGTSRRGGGGAGCSVHCGLLDRVSLTGMPLKGRTICVVKGVNTVVFRDNIYLLFTIINKNPNRCWSFFTEMQMAAFSLYSKHYLPQWG